MPHYEDPYEPPLRPKLRMERPPWWPIYKEYHGRPDWWTDKDTKDEMFRKGYLYGLYWHLKEFDRRWWDPKVPDGTSLVGPNGLDSHFHKNTTIKADQPGNFWEFQKKVREESLQYKQIAEKWKISEQHPGIHVNPLFTSLNQDNRNLGRRPANLNHAIQYHYGPRFWDKPMNEGCIEKGLCLSKYALGGTIFYRMLKSHGYRGKGIVHIMSDLDPWKIVKTAVTKDLPVPILLAMTLGVSICTSAKIRHKDDLYNYTIAGLVTGAAFMTLHDYKPAKGLIIAFPVIAIGAIIHFNRMWWQGLQGLPRNRFYSGALTPIGGPLNWMYGPEDDLIEAETGPVPNGMRTIF